MTRQAPPPLPGHRRRTNSVPPLEPPAPLASRLSRKRQVRDWAKSCRQALPSWFASMMLHVAIVVLIASLAMPEAPRALLGELMAVMHDGDDVANESEEVQLLSPADDPPATGEGQADEPKPEPAASNEEPDGGIGSLIDELLKQRAQPAPRPAPAPQPVPREPPRDSGDGTASFGPRGPNESATQAAAVDHVVQRFILYDINELKGVEGLRALKDFEALGPEAIPALVRGLNQSTRYSNSCPAIVIGRRLNYALENTNDPALIRYAVENIGRGVPADAHHLDVLRNIVRHWGDERDRLRRELTALLGKSEEVTIDEKTLTQYNAMRRLPPEKLLRTIDDAENKQQLLVALFCLQERLGGRKGTDPTRVLAGEAVTPLLEHDDAEVRQAALGVLSRLAGGTDLGPDAKAWRDHWASLRTVTVEREATAMLSRAQTLRRSGRGDAATRRLRDIIKHYPNSAAASEAQRLLGGR